MNLNFSNSSLVPKDLCVCPECGSQLYAESTEHVVETGAPTVGGLYVHCIADTDMKHKYLQMDWQLIHEKVANSCCAEEI